MSQTKQPADELPATDKSSTESGAELAKKTMADILLEKKSSCGQ